MSADAGSQKTEWVHRVLGVTIPASRKDNSGAGGEAAWARVRAVWQEASETVDGQIAALQAYLRGSGDDDLEEVAEYGLNGLTGGHKVKLMAALNGAGGADPASMRKAAAQLTGVIDGFASYIDASEAVEVCDDNPFGVPVSIRNTLGGAFRTMREALAASVGKS